MRSLRLKLLLLLGGAIVAATLLQFAASFRAASQEADKLADYHMQRMAFALQGSELRESDEWFKASGFKGNSFDFVIQIWTESGAKVFQPRVFKSLPGKGASGFSTVTLSNGAWRVYALEAESNVIQVSQKMDSRRDRAIALAWRSVWPILPTSLLLLAATWWVVTSALKPLDRIGKELAQRQPSSLEQVSTDGVPKEVTRLVDELNLLLQRVGTTLRLQKDFIADAAHELRSPLTALKLQVQTLGRAKDDASREQAIQRLSGGVARAIRLVEQLLALARQDHVPDGAPDASANLEECIGQAIADVASLAASRNVAIDRDNSARATLHGDAESLRVMIRNLLDNAVRHAPEGGTVRVTLATTGTLAEISVEDSGPGIPPASRARVFDRFYRIPGAAPGGSGLGLAIVSAIVASHGGTITLGDSALGGLRAAVVFPLVAKDPPAERIAAI